MPKEKDLGKVFLFFPPLGRLLFLFFVRVVVFGIALHHEPRISNMATIPLLPPAEITDSPRTATLFIDFIP